MYLLDTNVLIYYLRNEHSVVRRIDERLRHNTVLISSIVEAEVLSWPELTERDQHNIEHALASIPSIPVDSVIGRIAAELRRKYKIHLLDGLIAATAIRTHATLITRNTKDFRSIEELQLEKI